MANRLPKEISDFMEKYGVRSDEVWPVPGGKAYAVKHKALERIAVAQKITFERPAVIGCDLSEKSMVVCVFGKMGDREEWTFGEANPANNKNQYFAAMTEKRAKDRVILKLLSAHGDLYSEDEAEDFKRAPAADDEGIPRASGVQVLTVDAQRPIFSELEREMLNSGTVEELKRWKLMAKERASRLSDSWRKVLSDRYLEYLRTLEKREADEYIERMTG
ncbi:hypothetical protein [Bradyrhizobium sp. LVM 105]|uniref:hypothetical protein n=1 Tax=Bradyrhizobium sp. LVM 105 TaxID=2341115 RepID=UPI001FE02951|nr:hypothetical protein [Bradyrhizobium sp. LVM 105]